MEDDTDWDYHLKDQLAAFAQGSQYISGIPPNGRPHSPYGDDWDVLWLGHCASAIKPNGERRFLVENDNTVPLPKHRVMFSSNYPNMTREGFDAHTRVIFEAGDTLCTYAYALSLRGAEKVLRGLTRPNQEEMPPFDIGIGNMCRDNEKFKCISVFPNIIGSYSPPGKISADSDINPQPDSTAVREKGYAFNLVHSVRLNLDRLVYGETALRQHPEDEVLEGSARTRTLHRQE